MCPWIWRFKKGWLQNGQSSWFSPKCFSFTWRLQLDCIEKAVLQIAQMNPLSKPSFLITKSLIPEIIRGDVGYFYCHKSMEGAATHRLHYTSPPLPWRAWFLAIPKCFSFTCLVQLPMCRITLLHTVHKYPVSVLKIKSWTPKIDTYQGLTRPKPELPFTPPIVTWKESTKHFLVEFISQLCWEFIITQ